MLPVDITSVPDSPADSDGPDAIRTLPDDPELLAPLLTTRDPDKPTLFDCPVVTRTVPDVKAATPDEKSTAPLRPSAVPLATTTSPEEAAEAIPVLSNNEPDEAPAASEFPLRMTTPGAIAPPDPEETKKFPPTAKPSEVRPEDT